MVKIYGFSTFNLIKVLLTAEELGVDYEFIRVDPFNGELRSPEHLSRHPLGRMPVLEVDGRYLYESGAICRYLATTQERKLYSADDFEAARIDQMMDLVGYQVGNHMTTYYWNEVVVQKLMGKEPDQAALVKADKMLQKALPALDDILSMKKFLCGDQITIADTFSFPYLQIKEVTSADFSGYTNIVRWYSEMSARASTKKVMELLNGQLIPS